MAFISPKSVVPDGSDQRRNTFTANPFDFRTYRDVSFDFAGMGSATFQNATFVGGSMRKTLLGPPRNAPPKTWLNCTFRDVNMTGAQFRHAIFDRCTFLSCDMTGVDAYRSKWSECVFSDCGMVAACFRDAIFKNVRIEDCEMEAIDLGSVSHTDLTIDIADGDSHAMVLSGCDQMPRGLNRELVDQNGFLSGRVTQ